jgi:hypothetical protein
MTKRPKGVSSFGFRHSFGFRVSSFGLQGVIFVPTFSPRITRAIFPGVFKLKTTSGSFRSIASVIAVRVRSTRAGVAAEFTVNFGVRGLRPAIVHPRATAA